MGLQLLEKNEHSLIFCLTCYTHLSNKDQIVNYRVHNKISLISPNPNITTNISSTAAHIHRGKSGKSDRNEKRIIKYNPKYNLISVKKVYCNICSTLIGFRIENSFKTNFKIATLTGRIYFNVDQVIIDFKKMARTFHGINSIEH